MSLTSLHYMNSEFLKCMGGSHPHVKLPKRCRTATDFGGVIEIILYDTSINFNILPFLLILWGSKWTFERSDFLFQSFLHLLFFADDVFSGVCPILCSLSDPYVFIQVVLHSVLSE